MRSFSTRSFASSAQTKRREIFHVEAIKNYRSHVPSKDGGVGKSTLFQSTHLLLGLNCLEPGVEQRVHTHEGQDKFYHVLEGCGEFTVGDTLQEAGAGHTVWAPAGVLHGVRNRGEERLVLLVGIAPSP
jgi:mannose-6-phosphate isomerase-like protein (cupin superfamily)